MAALARVDAVKQRMDAAHETLQVDLTQSKHTFGITKTISYTAARCGTISCLKKESDKRSLQKKLVSM